MATLTTAEEDVLWRVFYAMGFRRPRRTPRPLSDANARRIHDAEARGPLSTIAIDHVKRAGLIAWDNGFVLTDGGFAAIGVRPIGKRT